jgi:hypothetical protein
MGVLFASCTPTFRVRLRDTPIPLTDVAIRKAKPHAKPYKLTDGGGLYLLVGGKYWRLKYRSPVERNKKGKPKEKLLALGVYLPMRAPDARAKRDAACDG